MRPHASFRAVAVVAALASGVACSKKEGAGAPSHESTMNAGSSAASPSAPPGCALPPSGELTASLTLPKGCSLVVADTVRVHGGATLTLEPGVRLAFAQGSGLVIDGRLVAKGTEAEPVTLTSSSAAPAPGDWEGVVFGEETKPGNTLDRVVVKYAGSAGGHCDGAVCIAGSRGDSIVSLTRSTISESGKYGFAAARERPFSKLEGNTFAKNKSGSLAVHAMALGGAGANTFTDPLTIAGDVTATTTWPELDAPVRINDPLNVHGASGPAVLTLGDGTELRFGADGLLSIGGGSGGGLVAKGAVFTSASAAPKAGDWVGLVFYEKADATSLDGCTVAYAGKTGPTRNAAVTFQTAAPKALRGVKIVRTTLHDNLKAAFASPDNDCGELISAASANTSRGAPACAK